MDKLSRRALCSGGWECVREIQAGHQVLGQLQRGGQRGTVGNVFEQAIRFHAVQAKKEGPEAGIIGVIVPRKGGAMGAGYGERIAEVRQTWVPDKWRKLRGGLPR